jgi:hypothetical protein
MSLGGLLRLFHDPRLAIACSLVWITLLTSEAGRPAPGGLSSLMPTAAGLMLTIAVGRLWITRHDATT